MSALPLKADIERHDWGGGGGLQIGGGGGHQCSGLVGSRRSRRASATSSLARIVRHRPKRSHVTTANRAAKMQSNLEAKMSDRALDRIVIELDTAVVQEVTEGRPAGKGVPDRVREATAARNAAKLRLEPRLHRLDKRA